jgi:hypothetical protein
MATIAEQITAVETAIAEAEGQAAFTTDGISVRRQNLETLYKRLGELRAASGRTDGQRPMIRRFSFGGIGYS